MHTDKFAGDIVAQVTARTAADVAGVNYHTAHLFYHKLRDIISAHLEEAWPLDGEVEVDEMGADRCDLAQHIYLYGPKVFLMKLLFLKFFREKCP